jgi:hypothetical protein
MEGSGFGQTLVDRLRLVKILSNVCETPRERSLGCQITLGRQRQTGEGKQPV